MKKTGRVVLAVVTGVVLWGLLWNVGTLGTQRLLPALAAPGEPITHAGVLLGFIAYSVVLSVLAGWVAAGVAGEGGRIAVLALALVNLVIGIGVEVSYWALMPAWYHVIFLALVVPATLYGGRLRGVTVRGEGVRRQPLAGVDP
jgi:hypothetical protein